MVNPEIRVPAETEQTRRAVKPILVEEKENEMCGSMPKRKSPRLYTAHSE